MNTPNWFMRIKEIGLHVRNFIDDGYADISTVALVCGHKFQSYVVNISKVYEAFIS